MPIGFDAVRAREWSLLNIMSDGPTWFRDEALYTFFDKLVDCLAAHLEVDKNRIYISGKSAGGHMSNRLLRERSELLAGGVVASGVFELTEPAQPKPLGSMAVLVTWGGDNDEYTGSSGGCGNRRSGIGLWHAIDRSR